MLVLMTAGAKSAMFFCGFIGNGKIHRPNLFRRLSKAHVSDRWWHNDPTAT